MSAVPYSSAYDRRIHGAWRTYARGVRMWSRQYPEPAFARRGYVQGVLPSKTTERTLASLSKAGFTVLDGADYLPGFRCSEKVVLKPKVGEMLNAGHRYYRLQASQLKALARVLSDLRRPVADAIGSPWRVLNLRVLQTLPSAQAAGPNTWHGDGFPPEILKVMIYFTPAREDTGTTEFQNEDGNTELILGPAGTWVLFKNSTVIHRGIPPRAAQRIAAEITLSPSFTFDLRPVVAGLNATYPEYPWSMNRPLRAISNLVLSRPMRPAVAPPPAAAAAKPSKAERARQKDARARSKAWRRRMDPLTLGGARLVNRLLTPVAINIGGGPTFVHLRWLNLEGAPGPGNPHPFHLSPTCTFPVPDGSIATVYTSHCIEHLDDATVARVMAETHRVLRPDGRLVVKIPDFDMVLDRWQAGDVSFFADDRWGMRRITETWPPFGVRDTIDFRAAMIFCGVWNDRYGDHFSGTGQRQAGAYHGPAPVDESLLRELRTGTASPHAIASALRRAVLELPGTWTFNHQNAWSRLELQSVLACAGLEVATFDADAVIAAAADVPGITTARSESLYCLARRRS